MDGFRALIFFLFIGYIVLQKTGVLGEIKKMFRTADSPRSGPPEPMRLTCPKCGRDYAQGSPKCPHCNYAPKKVVDFPAINAQSAVEQKPATGSQAVKVPPLQVAARKEPRIDEKSPSVQQRQQGQPQKEVVPPPVSQRKEAALGEEQREKKAEKQLAPAVPEGKPPHNSPKQQTAAKLAVASSVAQEPQPQQEEDWETRWNLRDPWELMGAKDPWKDE